MCVKMQLFFAASATIRRKQYLLYPANLYILEFLYTLKLREDHDDDN